MHGWVSSQDDLNISQKLILQLLPIIVCFEFGTFILVPDMLPDSYREIHMHTHTHTHAVLGENGKEMCLMGEDYIEIGDSNAVVLKSSWLYFIGYTVVLYIHDNE